MQHLPQAISSTATGIILFQKIFSDIFFTSFINMTSAFSLLKTFELLTFITFDSSMIAITSNRALSQITFKTLQQIVDTISKSVANVTAQQQFIRNEFTAINSTKTSSKSIANDSIQQTRDTEKENENAKNNPSAKKKKKRKKNVRIKNLHFADKKKLEIAAAKRLFFFKEGKPLRIIHERTKLFVNKIIKYLHFFARFIVTRKAKNEFNVDQKSIKSKKSIINFEILKIYVGIVNDSVLNKMWLKPNRIYREIIETSCFLQIFDKKKSEKINWTNPIEMKTNETRYDYHLTNCLRSKIAKSCVWFTTNMMKKTQKDLTVREIVKRHVRWKIQQHTIYKKKCKQYVLNKKRWKYFLIRKMQNYVDIDWSTKTSMKEILRLINSRRDFKLFDYKSLMTKKIVKSKIESQNNDIIEFENEN